MVRVLYLTFDGLLEPLGNSQIVRPISGLSRRGTSYHVVSLEKAADLADAERVRAKRHELRDAGVSWTFRPYSEGSRARDVARNIARLTRAAAHIARTDGIGLVHARAHLSAGIAWTIRRLTGLPYLFDMRGYWIDELQDGDRWVTRPGLYRAAKLGERRLVRDAAAVVTLTDIASSEVRNGIFGPNAPGRPVQTITTVADYDQFTIEGDVAAVPQQIRDRLRDKLVVAYVGALNASYAVDASLALFRELSAIRSDAHLLCLTRQTQRMRHATEAAGIDKNRLTVTTAAHDDIHQWLRLVDWGLLLLNETYAKRASMPTKLAEFFAAGVRPAQFGCNREVAQWVRRAGSGIVLESTAPKDLASAAEVMARTAPAGEDLARARARTQLHFGLAGAIDRYEEVLGAVGASIPGRQPL